MGIPDWPKHPMYYCLTLGGVLVIFWFLKFGLIEMTLPIILGATLYYRIQPRYIFYLGAFCLLTASIFLAIKQTALASDLSIIAFFTFITLLLQVIMANRSRRPISFPNGLTFLRNNLNKFLPVLLLIVIVLFASQSLIQTNGDIFAGDFSFPLNYDNYLQEHLHLWNEHGSWSQPEVGNHTIFLAPFFFLSSVFSLSMVAFNKLILVALLLIAALGSFYFIRKLLTQLNYRSLVTSSVVPFIAAIFYAFNPWIMGRLGHYFLAVGYALLPVIVLAFIYALNTRKFYYVILTALLFAAAGTVPHNILYIGCALLVVFLVWFFSGLKRDRAGVFKKYLTPSLGVIALFILFSLVWILPTFIASRITSGGSLSPDYLVRIDDIKNAYQDFSWSDFFLSSNKDLAQNIPWKIVGSLLLLFIPLGFALNIRKRFSWAMLLIFIGACVLPIIFLEFPKEYYALFFPKTNESVLGWLVRDPTRTIILVPFCVIIGLALTMAVVEKKMIESSSQRGEEESAIRNRRRQAGLWLAIGVIVILAVFYCYPLALDSLENSFLPVRLPADYWLAGEQLEMNADQNSRVVWYPLQSNAKEFEWGKDKSINNFVDRSFEVRSLGTSSAGGRQFNLLLTSAIANENPYLSELLSAYNISRIIYRKELIDEVTADIASEESYLANDAGLNQELATDKLKVFATPDRTSPIDIGRRSYVVLGGLDAAAQLASLESVNLADDLLIFLDQEKYDPQLVQRLIATADGVIFNGSDSLDLSAALLGKQSFIYPKDFTNRGDYRKHWSKTSVNDPLHGEWHEMLKNDFDMSSFDFDYNHGLVYAYTEKPADASDYYKPEIDIPISITADGDYTILVRYFSNPVSEAFRFTLGEFSATIDSFSNSPGFSWQSVFTGKITAGAHSVKLTNLAGLNAISTISVVSTSELAAAETRAREIAQNQVAYLHSLGYQNLFDKITISNPSNQPLLYGFFLNDVNNYKNQFYINSAVLKMDEFTNRDGGFKVSTLPLPADRDSVLSIDSQAVTPYINLAKTFYSPEPESVKIEARDKFSVAIDVKAEGRSKHRRIMTQPIPVSPNSSYFISFSARGDDTSAISGVIRQFEEADSSTPARSDRLEIPISSSGIGEKRFTKFFHVSPKAKFIKLEISTKDNRAGSFEVGNLQLLSEEAIGKITGEFIAFTPNFFAAEPGESPTITAVKSGPEKYIIQITDASKPFILKFAETYNPLWRAKIGHELLPQIIVDGVFNGYQIDGTGDFVVEIEFVPQKWMIIGLSITAGSIGVAIFLVFYFRRKDIRQRHEKTP